MERLIPTTFNLITAVICLILGVIVLSRNPRKLTHQGFFLLSVNLMLWALGVSVIINSSTQNEAWFWIVFTEIVACFIPATFYHFVGYFPRGTFEGNRYVAVALYVAAFIFACLAPTEWYVREVTLTPPDLPVLVHGPAYSGFLVAMIVAFFGSHRNLRKKMRHTEGQSRRQTQFVMFGVYCCAGFGIAINLFSEVFDIVLFQAYGPISTALVMGIFAYAMIRFHLLGTPVLLSRIIVMTATTVFVCLAMGASQFVVQLLLGDPYESSMILPIIVGSSLVALTLPRFKHRTREIVEGTLIKKPYDINKLYRQLAEEASEEIQLDDLLRNVADHLQHSIGVKAVRVLLVDENDDARMVTEFSTIRGDQIGKVWEERELLNHLRRYSKPLLLEKILHNPTAENPLSIANHLAGLDAFVCLPLKTSGGLVGILTLGQKASSEVYSEEELVAFHALVGPLGTAIANARLYREIDEVNTHLSRVLGQMREGVVAVDSDGKITTINEAAERVLGAAETGQGLGVLPHEVTQVLSTALNERRAIANFETTLNSDDGQQTPVLMSASYTQSPSQDSSTAVALIYDLTEIKRLEENVFRADRLSSLGVLAAGMAHEIKNPLVSIKTFSQLLLKRYDDPDFRTTFEDTVPGEVDRINSIVSRLLEFAKPRPIVFDLHSVQEIFRGVLTLVENQARKVGVTIELQENEDDVVVYADEQLLHQVFLNLILNSIDSMEEVEGGRLTVSVQRSRFHPHKQGPLAALDAECARVSIADTGCGIAEENINDLFTPFFTTKEEGSGLGLSVVHSIISEHGGELEVESTLGVGTTFYVVLPVAQEGSGTELTDPNCSEQFV